ncbi:hypothetical protein ACQ4PT_028409 [Festuca glaucescens]
MDIMDPYTSELLSAPLLPGAFSGPAAAHQTEFDDDYLRAIGALPRRPCANIAPATLDYPPTLEPSSLMLLPSCDLVVAALGGRLTQPAAEVSVPPANPVGRKRAAPVPVSDVAAPAKRPRISCPWVPDYDADIDFNLREKEKNVRQRPSPDYLEKFTRHHRLFPGRLHRAVSYVDRVLSARTLSSSADSDSDYGLHLLGAAAIFNAAKYEAKSAVLFLNASDIAAYCGFADSKEVTNMEREMLATLRFELSGPTAFTFVEHFTRHSRGERNNKIRMLAHQLANTSLFDYGCLQFMPSAVAATALFLATLRLDPAADNQQLIEDLTGYKPMDLFDGIYSLSQ